MHEQLLALLDDVEAARVELVETLDRVGATIADRAVVTDERFRMSEQDPVPGVELHEQLIGRLERMHHTVAAARAESIRIMVDEEGLTLSDVAKLLKRPRQLVSRLYRSASTAPD
jgi:hypothetical protein